MSKKKDLSSDAASSDPDTADRDRVELRRHAERNIERREGNNLQTIDIQREKRRKMVGRLLPDGLMNLGP